MVGLLVLNLDKQIKYKHLTQNLTNRIDIHLKFASYLQKLGTNLQKKTRVYLVVGTNLWPGRTCLELDVGTLLKEEPCVEMVVETTLKVEHV